MTKITERGLSSSATLTEKGKPVFGSVDSRGRSVFTMETVTMIVADSLVYYYNARQGATLSQWDDLSGNGRHLTMTEITSIDPVLGVYFNTANTRGISPAGNLVPVQTTFTYEAAVTIPNLANTGWITLGYIGGTDSKGMSIGSNELLRVYDGGGSKVSTYTIPQNQTIQIAMKRVSATSVALYINGTFHSNVTTDLDVTGVAGRLIVGTDDGIGDLLGHIAYIRQYSRELTDAEILQNYQVGLDVGFTPSEGTIVELAGTSISSSDTAATLKSTDNLAGTSTSSSPASAALQKLRKLVGTSPSSSSMPAANLKSTDKLAGTSTSSSLAPAAMQKLKAFAGTSISTSEAQTELSTKRTVDFVSATTADSSATATLSASKELGGTIAGVSDSSAAIARLSGLGGASTSSSDTTAGLKKLRKLTSTSISTSGMTADMLKLARSFAGALIAQSSAEASTEDKRNIILGGTSTADSAAAGTLRVKRDMQGSSEAAISTAANLKSLDKFTGTSITTSDSAGTLKRSAKLSGASTTSSDWEASSSSRVTLTGDSVSSSSMSATMRALKQWSGTSTTTSTAAATTKRVRSMPATSTSSSPAFGSFKLAQKFAGALTTEAQISAKLHRHMTWGGAFLASSAAQGTPKVGVVSSKRVRIRGQFDQSSRIAGKYQINYRIRGGL